MLRPRERIAPKMDGERAVMLVRELYGFRVGEIRELDSYDDKNYHVTCDGDEYVLKILNSLDSRDIDFVEAQNETMIHLDKRKINCPIPVKNVRGSFYAVEDLPSGDIDNDNGGVAITKRHVVRLLVYRAGSTLYDVERPIKRQLLEDLGRFVARLDATLAHFSHPGYENRSSLWMLGSIPKLRDFVFVIENNDDRETILRIIRRFEKEVLAVEDDLERGIIHGDLNERNILVDVRTDRVIGVIDFGDTHRSCLVFELAIAVCYAIVQARDFTLAKFLLDGYRTLRKVTRLEKRILKICVCARLAQSLTLGLYSHSNDPQNDYLLATQNPGWDMLKRLWPLDDKVVSVAWGLDVDDDDDDDY